MPDRLIPLLRNELEKAVRRKLPYFGILAVGLLSLVIHFAANQLSNAASANAWGYLAFAMQLISTDIIPIFVVVFAAMLLAEETGTGTIRAMLAAPVSRWELYLAKALAGMLHMMALTAAALVFSAIFAGLRFKFGAVGDSFGVVYPQVRAIRELLFGFLLSWIPLTALVMYGLLISTLIRTPGAAVAVGVSLLFLVDFTKPLVGLEPYIFTRHITYSWLTLQEFAQGMDYQWQPEMWKMMQLSGVSAVLMFGAGLTIFVRQDLNH